MSGDRLRHTTTRLAATSITALLAAVALAAPAPSNAALATIISPGDQVDYVTANANTQFCTIGYVYSGPPTCTPTPSPPATAAAALLATRATHEPGSLETSSAP
jgi:hypothetical protein